jgi:hypothetical protein
MSATRAKARPPVYRTFTMAQIEEASAEQSGLRNEVYGAEELMLMGRVKP